MHAFITGSHCYGKPHEGSDIDLVVRMDSLDAMELIAQSDNPPGYGEISHYGIDGLQAIRFNKLNILICTTDVHLACWKLGTEKCYEKCDKLNRPLTRPEAVEIFCNIFQQNGLT